MKQRCNYKVIVAASIIVPVRFYFFFHHGLQLLFGLFESSSADNYEISFKWDAGSSPLASRSNDASLADTWHLVYLLCSGLN